MTYWNWLTVLGRRHPYSASTATRKKALLIGVKKFEGAQKHGWCVGREEFVDLSRPTITAADYRVVDEVRESC